jgi:hypothetical protein
MLFAFSTRSSGGSWERISAPTIAFVTALAVVALTSLILWRMHLLAVFLAGSAFQATIFLLAVLAIIFGSIQFWDSRQQGGKMEHIARSMSTRYIGLFPGDMDEIISVVRQAHRELLIMADCADYGSYSRPETHQLLSEELRKARDRGVAVRCVVYDESLTRQINRQQFGEAGFAQTKHSQQFSHYFEFWSGLKPADPAQGFTYPEFLEVVWNTQDRLRKELLSRGVQIKPIAEKVLLFFFMQDKQDAVFVFEDIGAEERGLAFRTRDAKLVETFAGIFDRYWSQASSSEK